jgi:hypothetical protein
LELKPAQTQAVPAKTGQRRQSKKAAKTIYRRERLQMRENGVGRVEGGWMERGNGWCRETERNEVKGKWGGVEKTFLTVCGLLNISFRQEACLYFHSCEKCTSTHFW